MSLLEVNHLKKIYTARYGGNSVQALADVNFTIEMANTQPSWANQAAEKPPCSTSLPHWTAPPAAPCVWRARNSPPFRNDGWRSSARKNLGFVFQDFNLLDTFSIRDNILLPLVLDRMDLPGGGPPSEDAVRTAGTGRTAGPLPL